MYTIFAYPLYSQEAEEARAALFTQSTSIQQLQDQLKQAQEQLSNEERARQHARTLQRLVDGVISLYEILLLY